MARAKGKHGKMPVMGVAQKVAYLLHPRHRALAREHEISPPDTLRHNVLWGICEGAMVPYLQKFFVNPDDKRVAVKEWVDYQVFGGLFESLDLSDACVKDDNPLFFWSAGCVPSVYLKKIAVWIFSMRDQNSPAELANAKLSRVSEPIRARLSSKRKGQLVQLASNWQAGVFVACYLVFLLL